MGSTHYGKEHKRTCRHIAHKEKSKNGEADEQHHLTGETIDNVATEKTCHQRHDSITEKHHTNHVLVSTKMFIEIDRQKRRQQHEREENHEVGKPHLGVVSIPELILYRCRGHI